MRHFLLRTLSLLCGEADVQIPFRSCDRVGEILSLSTSGGARGGPGGARAPPQENGAPPPGGAHF